MIKSLDPRSDKVYFRQDTVSSLVVAAITKGIEMGQSIPPGDVIWYESLDEYLVYDGHKRSVAHATKGLPFEYNIITDQGMSRLANCRVDEIKLKKEYYSRFPGWATRSQLVKCFSHWDKRDILDFCFENNLDIDFLSFFNYMKGFFK